MLKLCYILLKKIGEPSNNRTFSQVSAKFSSTLYVTLYVYSVTERHLVKDLVKLKVLSPTEPRLLENGILLYTYI